jgi:hypothetical protein
MSYLEFAVTLRYYHKVLRQYNGDVTKRYIAELRARFPEYASRFDQEG